MQKSFEDALTSLLEDTLANRSAKQGAEKVKKTHATYGPTSKKSSTTVNQDMYFSKMLKGISVTGSYRSSLTWKGWVTRLKSDYFQRVKLAHRTKEKESLLSEKGSWPTPAVGDPEGGSQASRIEWKNGHAQLRKKNRPDVTYGAKLRDAAENLSCWATPSTMDTLPPIQNKSDKAKKGGCKNLREDVVNWATPNTMDHMELRSAEALKKQAETTRKGRTRPANLREQVDPESVAIYGQQDPEKDSTLGKNQESWPTPLEDDSSNVNPNQKRRMTLTKKVNENWPTPLENDSKDVEWGTAGKDGKKVTYLPGAAKQWSTPTCRDTRRGCNQRMLVKDVDKEELNWPTPTSQNNPKSGAPQMAGGKQGRKILEEHLVNHPNDMHEWPTPTESFGARGGKVNPESNHDTEIAFRKAMPENVGKEINPDWVEQLMGVPKGWTDLDDDSGNWQTPPAQLGGSYGHGSKPQLEMQARMNRKEFPEDGARPDPKIGKLNPNWVEQLMGVPARWTQLPDGKHLDNRIDRLRLLGNGVVPQVAEKAFVFLFDKLNKKKGLDVFFG